jgi:two-component system capsular synthesis sensor histidine kinase RcsC
MNTVPAAVPLGPSSSVAHVLLVEDSVLARDAMRLLLEATGRRVSAVGSVQEAIAVVDNDHPALALLDLTLPDGTGLQVARHLRSRSPQTVIVALTGHDIDEVRPACVDAGCTEVLLKPVSGRDLLVRVATWIDRSA